MSRADFIGMRNDLENQISHLRELYEGFVENNRALQLRVKEAEEKVERLRMTVTAVNNLVKGNVR